MVVQLSNSKKKSISEYLQALKNSPKYGPQVVCHKTFPKEDGKFIEFPASIPNQLIQCLKQQGIEKLYIHQGRAYKLIKTGTNVLVATPTSSGKSLIYNLPVLEQLLSDEPGKALYLFPLKALAQDQLRVIQKFEKYL